ncbi:hypothetical protein POVCU2_0022240 [Plasmodium ovale curtisi]|uniref:Uncharacterized protein n=1 Tax=Plasmodium ovale curtisi TaxID=864141 RepID=A0A1A8VXU3_PLAOA|nr:hypothetical protein POVCU2_0022240 [Plasmodium ovale curtisi]SBS91198.1 hypothetical protein POVCU1_020090 [Plasmodium ovale curtisi]
MQVKEKKRSAKGVGVRDQDSAKKSKIVTRKQSQISIRHIEKYKILNEIRNEEANKSAMEHLGKGKENSMFFSKKDKKSSNSGSNQSAGTITNGSGGIRNGSRNRTGNRNHSRERRKKKNKESERPSKVRSKSISEEFMKKDRNDKTRDKSRVRGSSSRKGRGKHSTHKIEKNGKIERSERSEKEEKSCKLGRSSKLGKIGKFERTGEGKGTLGNSLSDEKITLEKKLHHLLDDINKENVSKNRTKQKNLALLGIHHGKKGKGNGVAEKDDKKGKEKDAGKDDVKGDVKNSQNGESRKHDHVNKYKKEHIVIDDSNMYIVIDDINENSNDKTAIVNKLNITTDTYDFLKNNKNKIKPSKMRYARSNGSHTEEGAEEESEEDENEEEEDENEEEDEEEDGEDDDCDNKSVSIRGIGEYSTNDEEDDDMDEDGEVDGESEGVNDIYKTFKQEHAYADGTTKEQKIGKEAGEEGTCTGTGTGSGTGTGTGTEVGAGAGVGAEVEGTIENATKKKHDDEDSKLSIVKSFIINHESNLNVINRSSVDINSITFSKKGKKANRNFFHSKGKSTSKGESAEDIKAKIGEEEGNLEKKLLFGKKKEKKHRESIGHDKLYDDKEKSDSKNDELDKLYKQINTQDIQKDKVEPTKGVAAKREAIKGDAPKGGTIKKEDFDCEQYYKIIKLISITKDISKNNGKEKTNGFVTQKSKYSLSSTGGKGKEIEKHEKSKIKQGTLLARAENVLMNIDEKEVVNKTFAKEGEELTPEGKLKLIEKKMYITGEEAKAEGVIDEASVDGTGEDDTGTSVSQGKRKNTQDDLPDKVNKKLKKYSQVFVHEHNITSRDANIITESSSKEEMKGIKNNQSDISSSDVSSIGEKAPKEVDSKRGSQESSTKNALERVKNVLNKLKSLRKKEGDVKTQIQKRNKQVTLKDNYVQVHVSSGSDITDEKKTSHDSAEDGEERANQGESLTKGETLNGEKEEGETGSGNCVENGMGEQLGGREKVNEIEAEKVKMEVKSDDLKEVVEEAEWEDVTEEAEVVDEEEIEGIIEIVQEIIEKEGETEEEKEKITEGKEREVGMIGKEKSVVKNSDARKGEEEEEYKEIQAEDVKEVVVIEGMKKVEDAEEVKDVKEVEVVEEVKNIEEAEEMKNVENTDVKEVEVEEVNKLEPTEEVKEEEVEDVKEIEVVEEVEDVKEIEVVEEVKNVEQAEEVKKVEEVEDVKEVEVVEGVEEVNEVEVVEEVKKVEETEEVKEVEEVEEVEEAEEVKAIEEVEEVKEVEEVEEVEEAEEVKAIEEVEEVKEVEEVEEIKGIEQAEEVEEVEDVARDEEDVDEFDEVQEEEVVEVEKKEIVEIPEEEEYQEVGEEEDVYEEVDEHTGEEVGKDKEVIEKEAKVEIEEKKNGEGGKGEKGEKKRKSITDGGVNGSEHSSNEEETCYKKKKTDPVEYDDVNVINSSSYNSRNEDSDKESRDDVNSAHSQSTDFNLSVKNDADVNANEKNSTDAFDEGKNYISPEKKSGHYNGFENNLSF